MTNTILKESARRNVTSARVLLLGVTPDIARLDLPNGFTVLGIDNSIAMVASVWPGDEPAKRCAACGDWTSLPLSTASVDVAIGDGSLSCIPYPTGLAAVIQELHRVLRPDATAILRLYAQLEQPESPDAVIADALRGAISGFHVFKLRLLMSLQRNAQEGIAVNEVYAFWCSRGLDVNDVSQRTGWPVALIRSLELYRGTKTVHVFPTLNELRLLLHPLFDELSIVRPTYPLGDRCPILIARPKIRPNSAEA